MPMYEGPRRIARVYLGERLVERVYFPPIGLVWQPDEVVTVYGAEARGHLPPSYATVQAGLTRLRPQIGAFVAGPDDPIWQGSVGDVGALDESDPRLSGIGALPQRVSSTGAPNRPVTAPDYREYLFLMCGLEGALTVDEAVVEEPDPPITVDWYEVTPPGAPVLKKVLAGNPTVYEILPADLAYLEGLRIKNQAWRFRCRVEQGGLTADLPVEGFVELLVPGVPGAASTAAAGIFGIGTEHDLDVQENHFPRFFPAFPSLPERVVPPIPTSPGEIQVVEDLEIGRGGFELVGEAPAGLAFDAMSDGVRITTPPDRSEVYDRQISFRRVQSVDWATRGAEAGFADMAGAFIHLRLRNRSALALPAAPANLACAPWRRSVRLAWDDPENPTIDSYAIEYRLSGAMEWTSWNEPMTGYLTTAALVGRGGNLAVGEYDFRVAAVNEVGQGPWSETSCMALDEYPSNPPAPTNLALTFKAEDDAGELQWNDPELDGNVQTWIRSRSADAAEAPDPDSPGSGPAWSAIPPAQRTGFRHRVDDLEPGMYYGWQLQYRLPPLLIAPFTTFESAASEEAGGVYRRPLISIGSVEVREPESGSMVAALKVKLNVDADTHGEIAASYSVTGGTATAGDYVAVGPGRIIFRRGEDEKTIPVRVLADRESEGGRPSRSPCPIQRARKSIRCAVRGPSVSSIDRPALGSGCSMRSRSGSRPLARPQRCGSRHGYAWRRARRGRKRSVSPTPT